MAHLKEINPDHFYGALAELAGENPSSVSSKGTTGTIDPGSSVHLNKDLHSKRSARHIEELDADHDGHINEGMLSGCAPVRL